MSFPVGTATMADAKMDINTNTDVDVDIKLITDNDIESDDDIDDDDIDIVVHPSHEWLIEISARATLRSAEEIRPVQVGCAHAFVIRRSMIRDDFQDTMEGPHEATMSLAFDLFDRYGRLQDEVVNHPIRKGSGVWKHELDEGNLLLIEDVIVSEEYRRNKIGTKLVMRILEEVMQPSYNVAFAFAASEAYYSDDGYGGDNSNTSAHNVHETKVAAVTSFFRSLHFRRVGLTHWVALARNKDHPSWQLAQDVDVDPKEEDDDLLDEDEEGAGNIVICGGLSPQTEQRRKMMESIQQAIATASSGPTPAWADRKRPLHYAVAALSDKEALAFLGSKARWTGKDGDVDATEDKFRLDIIDGRGDTVLHVAAKATKPECLVWILGKTAGDTLRDVRNYKGYTPLEALEAALERSRVQSSTEAGWRRIHSGSDTFEGFDDASMTCLLCLRRATVGDAQSQDVLLRTKFGCTCGACIDGVLSQRMRMALTLYATLYHNELKDNLDSKELWYQEAEDLLRRLSMSDRRDIHDSTVLQKDFTELLGAIVECLEEKTIPRKVALARKWLLRRRRVWSIWGHPQDRTVAAVLAGLFSGAKAFWLDEGEGAEETDEDGDTPRCRNDREYEFVYRHCIYNSPVDMDTEKVAL